MKWYYYYALALIRIYYKVLLLEIGKNKHKGPMLGFKNIIQLRERWKFYIYFLALA